MTNLNIAAVIKQSVPETMDSKILWYDDFASPPSPAPASKQDAKSRPDKDLKALLQIREEGLAVRKEGEILGLNVSRPTGPEGLKYLQSNQKRLNLAMIEHENGDRFFVPKGQAKTLTGYQRGYNAVSSQQQSLESLGAIARKQDSFGIYYVGTKAAGARFLKAHREVPQRELKVVKTPVKTPHHSGQSLKSPKK